MYPINLDLTGQACLVLGGGSVAERKVRRLLDEGAVVTVIAPALTPALQILAEEHQLSWQRRTYQPGDETTFFLIICATDDEAVSQAVSAAAKAQGKLLNVCDVPDLCNFTLPSIVRQGDLQLTISTNGKAPAFSRWLRKHLEQNFDERYGRWMAELAAIRKEGQTLLATSRDRQAFWRQALTDDVMDLVENNEIDAASSLLRKRLAAWERKNHET
ncbi:MULTISPECIES: bifunctional precorrin-2 dehydrogenase/sirohydrochlorin ferrochelatase [Megasphaera]|jgi:precorrin-2 dehydrogenase/sirohydrochlorin ferrochelatase|uniref:precorrin-2 dehydrogenase/sirohydrochlorin ferrochelatase family protein n=1 Tax=Megasphaera TaxID=906 RepID=UPI00051480CA|nr:MULTISPECIES: bifunctional precorrin-2 dehydrogenase/sirohydrochlorin ferrochelatase [Megasphaera]KGI89074.1 siroheme synthase [Megasphaera elsdenii]